MKNLNNNDFPYEFNDMNTKQMECNQQRPVFDFDHVEPILNKENRRFTIFPIKYPKIWELYKKQQSLFWKAEEIDFSKDYDDFKKLNEDEQHFIKMVLAFFAASDGIVNFNLRERFLKDVQIMEAQVAYAWQMMMENIHNESYSQMLENIIKNPVEKERLFNAIQTVPSVKLMADWAFKWIESSKSFAYRLVAFAIIEGVFFSSAFASIFWLKRYRGKGQHFLNGLIKSNEFISRDEAMHYEFACELYKLLENKLPKEEIYNIMDEAVDISKIFTNDAIPCKLIGMNDELMYQYIEYIGDRLLVMMGYPKKYNKDNPFDFMVTIALPRKSNFFEHRPTDYQSAHKSNTERKIVRLENF
ncbi:ribonucleoside diphosphate reductase beta subunit [Catovirus CTV1]|uniref:ribonucleoside-diphosphate reductase n=1 Tax=Catovirus CTV1 TaxID=1977631 RepID=A0A1V0SC53_9VIRU|nr:ribonucleoside diphosphate reductase beta subunit [Catovirus CTV1]